MEISLMYVFIAAIGFGLIAVILLGLLLSKVKLMSVIISDQSSKEFNHLLGVINDLSTSTNLRIDGIITSQNDIKEQNVNLLKLIGDSFKENAFNSLKQFEGLSQQNSNSIESFKKISNAINLRFDDVINGQTESKESNAGLQGLITKSFNESENKITTAVNLLSDNQNSIHGENKELNSEMKTLIAAYSEEQKTSSARYFSVLNQEQKDNSASTQKQINEAHDHLSNKVGSLSRELDRELKTQSFKIKQERTSAFEQLSSLIQTIRVENLSEITSNIAKQKNLKINTSDFEKHLGDCKVVQMIDKHTGQVTRFNYEKGIKRSSDTLDGDVLKYQMFFDDQGKVSKGVEFNDNGDITFEYEYDKAGEISKRNEYIYSNKTKAPKKLEKVY